MEFSVLSAHDLDKKELTTIQHFLEEKTKKTIIYNHKINKDLIAGIRLLSNTLLWEHSIAQQLRDAEQLL